MMIMFPPNIFQLILQQQQKIVVVVAEQQKNSLKSIEFN